MVVLWWSSLVPWASELLSRIKTPVFHQILLSKTSNKAYSLTPPSGHSITDMVQLDQLRRCDSMHLWRASGERQTCHGGCDGRSGLDMFYTQHPFGFWCVSVAEKGNLSFKVSIVVICQAEMLAAMTGINQWLARRSLPT